MGVIIFDGQSSRDHGIIVEEFPALNHGAKRGEAYQLAGRNGTLYREDETYDNYVQAYSVAIKEGRHRRADLRAADIAAWLLGSSGFCRLEDSFEPEYYKMARFAGPLNIAQIMGRYGRCTLEFDCLPERWLKEGEKPLNLASNSVVFNPTSFTAKPLITISKNGAINLQVDGTTILEVASLGQSATVVIDCDACTIKAGGFGDLYSATTFYTTYNDFPTIKPGRHTISVDGGADTISVVPRWYVL